MVKETEYYDTLGVAPDCDEAHLKRAYKRLALKFHPDKCKDPDGEAKFKAVGEAYEVLSDPEKRRIYDQHGKKGLEEGGGMGHADASDIFSAFFGGRKRGGEPKPKDIVHEFQISLEEFYNGKTKKIAATRDRLCTACDATGIKKDSGKTRDDFQCSACHGQGVQVMLQPVMMGLHQRVQVKCKSCNGRGYDIPASMQCNKCEGKQTVKERKILEVHIEKGMKRNDSITLQGEGDQIPGVRLSGDVIIVLAQKKHDFFQRRGRHLFIDQEITLAEALTGFQLPIQHLDGRQLLIKTRPGQVLDPQRLWVIDREGMPVKGTGGAEKGCLVINFTVKFPEKLTQSQISGLHEALGQPDTIEKTAEHEECTLTDYVPKKPQRGENMRGHPMMMQVDDDDEDGHPHMQQASCQHQ